MYYHLCRLGRRGTKRKAEVPAEEENPEVEEKKEGGAEENGPQGQRVIIEHWSGVKSALLAARPDLTVVLNPEKPRRNSFEITLLDGETSLWTGIKKGPPRKLKFPEPDVVVAALQEALKTD
uniref:Selenoprotein H n=1 Tax=Sphaeramia orbicularis TaxID=375764 RepID=A0A673A4Y8_9TELE